VKKKNIQIQNIVKKLPVKDTENLEKVKQSQNLAAEQRNRVRHMRNYCAKQINITDHRLPGYLFFTDNERAIYCPIPKVACSTWKQVMLWFDGKMDDPFLLEDKDKDKERVHTMPFNKITLRENANRLPIYYTFLFVRHPYDRLLSAFRNKFLKPFNDIYRNLHGVKILNITRPHLKNPTINHTRSISFNEFVTFVIHCVDHGIKLDVHWERMTLLCRPCAVKYDFIGKMDTLIDDSNAVLDELGVKKTVRFTTSGNEYKVNVKDMTSGFYAQISDENIYRIYDIYKGDFQAFGYDIPWYISKIIYERTKKSWQNIFQQFENKAKNKIQSRSKGSQKH